MAFDWFAAGSIYFWLFFAALFFGAACARATRPSGRVDKWTLVFLYLSAAVALGALAVLVPGAKQFHSVKPALFAAAVGAVGFLGNRHKLSVGAPIALAAGVVLLLFALFLQGWIPLRGDSAVIGTVRVLSVTTTTSSVEVSPKVAQGNEVVVTGTLPAGSMAAGALLVRFDEAYFFLAAGEYCRLVDVGSVGPSSGTPAQPRLSVGAQGPAGVAPSSGASPIVVLPGVAEVHLTPVPTAPRILESYDIVAGADRTVRLLPEEALSK